MPLTYEEHGLPPAKGPAKVSAGEVQVLRAKRALRFFQTIQEPQVRIRRTHKQVEA